MGNVDPFCRVIPRRSPTQALGVHHPFTGGVPPRWPGTAPRRPRERTVPRRRPDRFWFCDITQHRVKDGWVYCAGRHRRLLPPDRRLVDLGPNHRGDRRRRARHGSLTTPPRTGQRRPRGPRSAMHQLAVRAPALPGRAPRIDGQGGVVRGQRAYRVVLVDDATRAAGPHQLRHSTAARVGHIRVDRRVLQPAPTTHQPRQPQSRRLRSSSHRRLDRGMINTQESCGKPGQAPCS